MLLNSWGVNSSEALLPLPISKLIFLSRAPIESDTVRLTPGLNASLFETGDGVVLVSKASFCEKTIKYNVIKYDIAQPSVFPKG